jgi:hypothetical protein
VVGILCSERWSSEGSFLALVLNFVALVVAGSIPGCCCWPLFAAFLPSSSSFCKGVASSISPGGRQAVGLLLLLGPPWSVSFGWSVSWAQFCSLTGCFFLVVVHEGWCRPVLAWFLLLLLFLLLCRHVSSAAAAAASLAFFLAGSFLVGGFVGKFALLLLHVFCHHHLMGQCLGEEDGEEFWLWLVVLVVVVVVAALDLKSGWHFAHLNFSIDRWWLVFDCLFFQSGCRCPLWFGLALACWPVGWLAGWSLCLVAGWLVGYLAGCFALQVYSRTNFYLVVDLLCGFVGRALLFVLLLLICPCTRSFVRSVWLVVVVVAVAIVHGSSWPALRLHGK